MFKILIIKMGVITVFVGLAFAQPDSIIRGIDADFTLRKSTFVRYQGAKEVSKLTETVETEDISSVMFFKKDSLLLLNDESKWFGTSIHDIERVTLETGNISPILGIVPGVFAGGLAGWCIGYGISRLAVGDPHNSGGDLGLGSFFTVIASSYLGALLGAVAGGITGAIIISAINHKTLDLHSVADKQKKSKLIKFLKQKKIQ